MTCTRYEDDIALYVEHDLPQGEVPALEDHLHDCLSCRDFLRELGASQGLLRDLAEEPMRAEALAAVRTLAISAFEQQAERPRAGWGWVVAAALVAAIGVASWLTMRAPTTGPRPHVAADSSPSAEPDADATPVTEPAAVERHESGSLPKRAVPAKRPAGRASSHPVAALGLSPEDADQLARAVVAVSRIQRLPAPATEPPLAPSSGLLVRLATANPDVVIYWRLDPNGGQ